MTSASARDDMAPGGGRVRRQHGRGTRMAARRSGQGGSAVVEFALVAPLAVAVALAVAQFALFLYERNVVMGSLSEGARVAAASGRTTLDGERAASKLLHESLGGRVAAALPVRGTSRSGLVVLRAEGTLPSFVPGVPGLEVRMTAAMHKEEGLVVSGGGGAAPGERRGG